MTFVFDEIFFIECLFGRPPFSFTTIEDLIHTIKSDIPIEVKELFKLIKNFIFK